jgi:hypothetical protein
MSLPGFTNDVSLYSGFGHGAAAAIRHPQVLAIGKAACIALCVAGGAACCGLCAVFPPAFPICCGACLLAMGACIAAC